MLVIIHYYNNEHFVLHIWDIRPIPTIRTTVRIIMCVLAKESYKVKHRVDMLHLPGSDTLE